ncbi:MAG: CDP-alcohol phosphatidyltransferase family protein [Bacillota bacterium]
MLNLPNILTIIRLILVGVFYFVFNIPDYMAALAIFLVAGATDVLDGYIARKYNLITDLGKLLDPLADKLLLIVALFCLYSAGNVPLVFPILATVKELAMVIGGALLLTREHKVVYSKTIGKIAAGIFFLGVVASFFKASIDPFHIILLSAGLALSVAALFSYAFENIFRGKAGE